MTSSKSESGTKPFEDGLSGHDLGSTHAFSLTIKPIRDIKPKIYGKNGTFRMVLETYDSPIGFV